MVMPVMHWHDGVSATRHASGKQETDGTAIVTPYPNANAVVDPYPVTSYLLLRLTS